MGTSRKKVDTWYFNLEDVLDKQIQRKKVNPKADEDEDESPEMETVQRMEERKIAVDLFMEKETEEAKTPPHPLEKVKFIAKCYERQYNLNLEIDGTDIEAVRAAVWAEMDKRFEIKWHEYYKVYLEPARIYIGRGEGFDFYYDEVWKGITWEGRELLREWSRGNDYHYKISPWPGRFTDRNGNVIACIPRNDMTEEALKEFAAKITKMREVLKHYLTPEAIMATLSNMSGLKLLEASTEQVAAEEQDKHERKKTSPSKVDAGT